MCRGSKHGGGARMLDCEYHMEGPRSPAYLNLPKLSSHAQWHLSSGEQFRVWLFRSEC